MAFSGHFRISADPENLQNKGRPWATLFCFYLLPIVTDPTL